MDGQYLNHHESSRLIYKPLSLDLIETWKRFLNSKDSTNFFPPNYSEDKLMAEKWIQGQLIRYAEGRYGLLAVEEKTSGQFVGQIGLISQRVNEVDELEIGYHLMPEFRGRGFASEGAIYMKEYAISNALSSSVISLINPLNKPSQRVAQKNEMVIDGKALHHGITHDIWRFSFS